MKLIVDIDEDVYKKIVADKYAIYDKMFYPIKNGTPIPNNATNGDVIKAMFPNEYDFETDFDAEWWNAPYQKGGKE